MCLSAVSCFQCNDWRTTAVRFEEAGVGNKSPQEDYDDCRHLRFSQSSAFKIITFSLDLERILFFDFHD